MHPAVSVIIFTVTSGAGLGFIMMLGLGLPMPAGPVGAFFICLIGGGLTTIGLLSSLFHLGHPERFLKAFSQWRSSWLSREGVLSVGTLLLLAAYGLIWMLTGERIAVLGWLMSAMALATVYATAMIYAQMKTVPHWNSPMTPACYIAFAAATGFLLAASISGFAGLPRGVAGGLALVLVLIAWALKLVWWSQAGANSHAARGSDEGTATGLGVIGKVKLLERPHTGENYLTKEMVHVIGRKHASKIRMLALAVGAAIPLLIAVGVWLSILPTLALLLGAAALLGGLFAERWLFFAEAQHAVSLYYGAKRG